MNYEKQCWYCGKQTMERKGNYYQCTECGATWNEQPVLGLYPDIATDHKGQRGTKAYHPVMKRGKIKPPFSETQKASRRKARALGIPL